MLQNPNLASLFISSSFVLGIYLHSPLLSAYFYFHENISKQEEDEMYAETGLAFRSMQCSSPEIQQFEDFFKSYKLSDEMNNLVEAYEFDFGEECELFKAPEPVIEEPMLPVDLSDFGSLESDQELLDKAFYECEQDLLVKSAMESPLSEVVDIKNVSLVAKMENVVKSSSVVASDAAIPKSVSSGNLTKHEAEVIQSFPDFPPVDYGMRRAFSESDIQTLGTRQASLVQSQLDRVIVSCTSEDRREKLSRYRNKKGRRNFSRKIKYACRKALADSQPRIRGRFAKTEEMQI